jgi:hypothetical protein
LDVFALDEPPGSLVWIFFGSTGRLTTAFQFFSVRRSTSDMRLDFFRPDAPPLTCVLDFSVPTTLAGPITWGVWIRKK